jgi:tetratricopeptide (TPR) repeat protein
MESDITQSALFYRLWEWVETRRKQLIWGTAVIAVAGFGIGFFFWSQGQSEAAANNALSKLTSTAAANTSTAADFLTVASAYPRTEAGGRALLLAGARFFAEEKFTDAQAQFDRYLREYRNGAFAGQASLGRAACLEASGKAMDAITAYLDIADHHPTDNVAPQARLALGRLYESQGNYDLARQSYEPIARPDSLIGSEAAVRLEELINRNPSPRPVPGPARRVPTNPPALNLPVH